MLNPSDLYDYQKQAVIHQLYNPHAMLWLGMGLGKTAITLTSIEHRMREGSVNKTLIFGPARVIHGVWEREARKWSHLNHLRCSVMAGTPDQRRRALFYDADIYLCSYENMNWLASILVEHYVKRDYPIPFQYVVYDEVSKMKNSQTMRYKGGKREQKERATGRVYEVNVTGWKKVAKHFTFTSGLTGTPASNGYIDLFGQYLVVDGGVRLGEYLSHYRDNYFTSDYMGWGWTPTEEGMKWIEHNISDITIKMDAKDYLDLPDSTTTNMYVDLPPKARTHYDEIEKDMFTALDNGTDVEVFSKNSISNKCLQVCNGAAYYQSGYDSNGEPVKAWDKIHDAKLDALEEILEEAAGQPVLLAYSFTFDAERIMKRFKKYKPVNMTAEKARDTERIINDWNAGKTKLIIGHPASIGHGVDGLQDSGSIVVWFGANWSLELTEQLNKRIDRNGQDKPVKIIRILCRDTVDMVVVDALINKDDTQKGLMNAIQRYKDGLVDLEALPEDPKKAQSYNFM
jgi:SNF2 family DNA or RNA helicase